LTQSHAKGLERPFHEMVAVTAVTIVNMQVRLNFTPYPQHRILQAHMKIVEQLPSMTQFQVEKHGIFKPLLMVSAQITLLQLLKHLLVQHIM